MAELLAIEWEHEHVCGVQAHITPGGVRIDRTFVVPRPVVSATEAVSVDWLRSELASRGITGEQVLIALPRHEAIVKRLELPNVADDELPAMVRFQAGAKSSVALDELSLDYIPHPRQSEAAGREVLMATVSKEMMDSVAAVCQTAGLQPIAMGLTVAAVAEFVARAESGPHAAIGNAATGNAATGNAVTGNVAGGASLVVARHGNRIEVSILRRCHLLFAHSTRLSESASGQEAQAILAEVSRALVALRGAIADVRIERTWTLVSASEHEQLAESLHRRMQCEVLALDPFSSVERDSRVGDAISDRALFAGPIGMLLAKSDPRVPGLDFLSPRRPPVKRDVRKQRMRRIGTAVAALSLILGAALWLRLDNLDSQLADLGAEEARLNGEIKRGEPEAIASAAVADWQAAGEDWLDELLALTSRLPPNDRVCLESLRCTQRLGPTAPGKIVLQGITASRDDATNLNTLFLAADDRFQGQPVLEEPGKSPDEFYRWQFTKELRLTRAKTPSAGSRSRAGNLNAERPSVERSSVEHSSVEHSRVQPSRRGALPSGPAEHPPENVPGNRPVERSGAWRALPTGRSGAA